MAKCARDEQWLLLHSWVEARRHVIRTIGRLIPPRQRGRPRSISSTAYFHFNLSRRPNETAIYGALGPLAPLILNQSYPGTRDAIWSRVASSSRSNTSGNQGRASCSVRLLPYRALMAA